jgi:beta-glucosidase
MVNYSMEGRTYRYSKWTPMYPFGYGLSYSTFGYTSLLLPDEIRAGENITISATVTNYGPYDADEVSQ